jgi:hypothetical protein
MRALALTPLGVLGRDEIDTRVSPLLGERVRVIHVQGAEALPLVMGYCLGHIRDYEDRLNTDDPSHNRNHRSAHRSEMGAGGFEPP